MNYLLAGHESKERVELLLRLTKIKSEAKIDAIYDHLVNGFTENEAARLSDVSVSNFNKAMMRVKEVAEIVEKIKEKDSNLKWS